MKRLLLPLFAIVITFSGCSTLKNLGLIPSELEMGLGLKDGLTQGLFKAFNAFSDPHGNPLVRFVLPGEAAKIEKTLRDLGLDKTVDQVTGKFTRAMSSAVNTAKPMFINSIKEMTIKDAVKILVTDNPHAATDYFKTSMKPELMTAFRPIVDSAVQTEGAGKEWIGLVNIYNKIPFINKPLESSLTDFISARAIDVMFLMIASEEAEIRSKYEFRKTDMMKKVFGYAERELKRRMGSE
jgi:hypothetical protein